MAAQDTADAGHVAAAADGAGHDLENGAEQRRKTGRMGECSTCKEDGKYRCPGCQAVSCSAACVAAHKKASGCSGKRNRAEFVDIHSLGDRHLISDYRLLEETQQVAERAKRTYADPAAAAAAAAALQHGPFAPAPRRRERRDRQASALAALQQRAQAKGVNLMFQPAGMTRHDSNTTSFDKKGNRMNWHVEWVFGDFRPCPVSRIREDVCPLDALKEIFGQAAQAPPGPGRAAAGPPSTSAAGPSGAEAAGAAAGEASGPGGGAGAAKTGAGAGPGAGGQQQQQNQQQRQPRPPALTAAQKHELRRFAGDLGSVRLFLEKAGVAASQKNRWLEIPLSEPLGASLQGKWLVEFPTLHVAAPGEEGRFPVASSAEPEAPPPENRWL